MGLEVEFSFGDGGYILPSQYSTGTTETIAFHCIILERCADSAGTGTGTAPYPVPP